MSAPTLHNFGKVHGTAFRGPAALILSCILMNLTLLWLRDSHEGFGSSAILAFGNLLLGFGIFLPRDFGDVRTLKSIAALGRQMNKTNPIGDF
jgi:hypothetical protein